MTPLKPAVFLDRDGVVIEDAHYLADRTESASFPVSAEAIAALNRAGWPVVVVTNQSGVARGLSRSNRCTRFTHISASLLDGYDARIDAFHFCPHHPEGEVRRISRRVRVPQAEPGMLLQRRGRSRARPGRIVDDRRPRERSGSRRRRGVPHDSRAHRLWGVVNPAALDRDALKLELVAAEPGGRRGEARPSRVRQSGVAVAACSNTSDVLIVGGGIVGLGTGDGAGRAGFSHHHRNRARTRPTSDRPQQRRHSLRPLLQAGFREGAATAPPAANRCTASAQTTASRTIAAASSSSPRANGTARARGTRTPRARERPCRHSPRLTREEMREVEPHVAGIAGLRVPETGIVNYKAVAEVFAEKIAEAGGRFALAPSSSAARAKPDGLVVETTAGPLRTKLLVNCAGLHSDRVARLCGVDPGVQIVPFRGEYFELKPRAEHLCKHLIYPVPDAAPAVPRRPLHADDRRRSRVRPERRARVPTRGLPPHGCELPRPAGNSRRFGGFWKMARKFWWTGMGEMYRSFSRRAFWHALQGLIPEVKFHDLVPAGAGVRAQAVAARWQTRRRFLHPPGRPHGSRPERAVTGRDGVHRHRPNDRRHGDEGNLK